MGVRMIDCLLVWARENLGDENDGVMAVALEKAKKTMAAWDPLIGFPKMANRENLPSVAMT